MFTNRSILIAIGVMLLFPAISFSQDKLKASIIKDDSGKYHLQIRSVWITKQFDEFGRWKSERNPQDVISIFLQADGPTNSKPIPTLGDFKADLKTKSIIFTPRFSFTRSAIYNVELRTGPGMPSKTSFRIPRPFSNAVTISAVYPSADKLPENLLKFYVHFSGPMKRGDIYKFVRIENADGKKIELPFLEIEQELWSRDQKRLTLLLDPGRIKRGLKPREEMGPILVAGKKYRFVIDGKWASANGKPLGKDYVKEFTAIKEDTDQPDVRSWKITAPKADTKQALSIELQESLDHALLSHHIQVLDKNKKPVKGTIEISNHETVWKFRPSSGWKSGQYSVEIDQRLEDLVGNSIGRKFDVDQFNKTERTTATKSNLKFEIK